MGHGLTALLVGAEFDYLLLHADGSGIAVWHGTPGAVATALIAAGGLLGPTLVGVGILLLSRSAGWARWLMAGLAVLMAASVLLWSRNAFGAAFLLASAASLAVCARLLPPALAALVLHLMAVTLCLSWFTDLDYMFSDHAMVSGVRHLSDSAVMAQALWMPYWFWGGAVAVFSLAVVVLGVGWVSRQPHTA